MANRLSRSAPYQIHSFDIHSINDVFRQVQNAIDFLMGLNGPVTIYDNTNINGDLSVSGDTNITGALSVTDITFDTGGTITGIDASDVTYTPAVVANWGGSDPGNVDDALDYLAANAGSSSSTSTDLIDGDAAPWEELVSDSIGGGSMRIQAAAGGNGAELRALEPVTVGDSLIGELQLLDDGTDALIYA